MAMTGWNGASIAMIVLASQLLSGCTTIPSFVLSNTSEKNPAGPKVAALVSNVKCELWAAVRSDTTLPFYVNSPDLKQKNHVVGDDRKFDLTNLFKEIEYVGETTFTLDVTETGAFNPTVSLSEYLTGAQGLASATGAVLSVGGTLSESAHRFVTIDLSIDFSRLIESPPNPYAKNPAFIAKPNKITPVADDAPNSPCDGGSELAGDLGLEETLAVPAIAFAMNDIAVFPTSTSGGNAGVAATAPVISVGNAFAFGQISAQVDFTIIENVNGGPTWTLKYWKLPGQNSAGLFNYGRQVKDMVTFTFVPVCIREKYWTNSSAPPYQYEPEMMDGTPGWANYLPPCDSANHLQAQIDAVAKAKNNNNQLILQNSFRQ